MQWSEKVIKQVCSVVWIMQLMLNTITDGDKEAGESMS